MPHLIAGMLRSDQSQRKENLGTRTDTGMAIYHNMAVNFDIIVIDNITNNRIVPISIFSPSRARGEMILLMLGNAI